VFRGQFEGEEPLKLKKEENFFKFLFIAYDVWEQTEGIGGNERPCWCVWGLFGEDL
jgi:hypothetical protein